MMITKTNGTTTAAMFRPSLPFDGGNDRKKTENIHSSTCNNYNLHNNTLSRRRPPCVAMTLWLTPHFN